MKTKIIELIKHFDKNEDALLIGLLKQKVIDNKNEKHQNYLNKHYITDKELSRTKNRGEKMLYDFLYENLTETERYKKIELILDRTTECDNCKYSIIKKHVNTTWDITSIYRHSDETIRCHRCGERSCKLTKLQDEMAIPLEKIAEYIKTNDEFIMLWKCKAVINKIRRKIINLTLQNHETS